LLAVGVLIALAQPCCAVERKMNGTEWLIRLSVHPMAAPRPALRYQLLPELRDMEPGNPIQSYLACYLDHAAFFGEGAYKRQEKLRQASLQDLAAMHLGDYGAPVLRLADRAARMDSPDWQALLKVKSEVFGLPLPEVEALRSLMTALQVRFRIETAECRFDAAVRTAQTMLAIARHMDECPVLRGNLVGSAFALNGITSLEEMLEQPGCPNLYWALTSLPTPFVSPDRGMAGEQMLLEVLMTGLDESSPMSEAQMKKLLITLNGSAVRAILDSRTKDKEALKAARRRLVEHGLPEERVQQFLPKQVVLLDEKHAFEARRDDMLKLMTLPTWQFEEHAAKVKAPRTETLWDDLLTIPMLLKVRRVQGQLEQRIALLRHVEALRMYAAEHDGKLPEKLSDITVPLPMDPYSNKPFRYQAEGAVAHLRGCPPPGQEKIWFYNLHFEVKVQK
jgi:hypothetical protein